MIRLIILLSKTQQYGFQKQWTSLNGSILFTSISNSTSKANFPSQIAAFAAVPKTQKGAN